MPRPFFHRRTVRVALRMVRLSSRRSAHHAASFSAVAGHNGRRTIKAGRPAAIQGTQRLCFAEARKRGSARAERKRWLTGKKNPRIRVGWCNKQGGLSLRISLPEQRVFAPINTSGTAILALCSGTKQRENATEFGEMKPGMNKLHSRLHPDFIKIYLKAYCKSHPARYSYASALAP